MELILKAKDIRVEFKGRDVLDINELEVYDYDRIGLVGANGAGKSTLLRVLLGELTPPGCKMNRLGELAYIPQLDEVTLQEEKDFALVGKLGVEQLNIQTMSGGEETRLKIAQALSAQVHGILADEPTSHLDREGIDFLIGQLKYFTGALLVISHDRYFLDEIVDKIWELKDGKITEYWGNYSDYLRQKEEERKSQAAEYEQFIAERARLERAAEEKRKQARKKKKKARRKISFPSGGAPFARIRKHYENTQKILLPRPSFLVGGARPPPMADAHRPHRLHPLLHHHQRLDRRLGQTLLRRTGRI